METAAQSGESSIAEELMVFFVEKQERECFAALLYTCYDLIKPDQALEVAWTHGLVDFVMPYMIQYFKDYTGKVAAPPLPNLKFQNLPLPTLPAL
jgi:clathrin heavy chain